MRTDATTTGVTFPRDDEAVYSPQKEYEHRVLVAMDQGHLVNYQERVHFGKPYAWVQWKGSVLRLLPLARNGVLRPDPEMA